MLLFTLLHLHPLKTSPSGRFFHARSLNTHPPQKHSSHFALTRKRALDQGKSKNGWYALTATDTWPPARRIWLTWRAAGLPVLLEAGNGGPIMWISFPVYRGDWNAIVKDCFAEAHSAGVNEAILVAAKTNSKQWDWPFAPDPRQEPLLSSDDEVESSELKTEHVITTMPIPYDCVYTSICVHTTPFLFTVWTVPP